VSRPDFRALAARRLAEERELDSSVAALIGPDASTAADEEAQDKGSPARFAAKPRSSVNARVARLLVRHTGSTFDGEHVYLGLALYFESLGLRQWANLFRERSARERRDADACAVFLADNTIAFRLPRVRTARTRFKTPARALRRALRTDHRAMRRLTRIARAATSQRDHQTLRFLGPMIGAQDEDERATKVLFALTTSGVDLLVVEPLLPVLTESRREPTR
jgi:ferritin